ncbi:MAG: hypothetical protein CL706_06640 [Chloroflexi bacterium]|nr:hypothetical protein [Chloroflexota bacterium]|tara:strand:- start:1251 stop:3197 length:1947 start_codon:yes stop_codon:yes gene_type:complete
MENYLQMNLKKNYIKFGVNGVTNKEDFINEIATEADAIIQKHINANNTKNIDLLNEVENEYKNFLEKFPNDADMNHNLGIILNSKKLHDDALIHYNNAIKAKPNNVNYYVSKSSSLFELKKYNECLEALIKAESLDPLKLSIIKNLGVVYRVLKDEEKALPYLKKFCELSPNDLDGKIRFGLYYVNTYRYEMAKKIFMGILAINPDHIPALNNYANCCQSLSETKEAEKIFKKLEKLHPTDLTFLNIGSFYQEKRKMDLALKYYNKSLEKSGENKAILSNIATVYGEIGEKTKASNLYKKVLDKYPNSYKSFKSLAYTDTIDDKNHITIKMINEFKKNNKQINPDELSDIGFGLTKIFDKQKKYEIAANYAHKSNKILRNTFQYNQQDENINIDNFIKNFNKSNYSNFDKSDIKNSPIFITGMPRSGTSLVEQIISNHPNVSDQGELTYMMKISKSMQNQKINKTILNDLGKKYLKSVLEYDETSKELFTDKLPANLANIGLIKLIFPNSKIIICDRDLRDVTTSLYLLKLTGGHPYIYNEEELSNYANLFCRLARHWLDLFQDEIYLLDYENFIDNQLDSGEKLFKYLGLDFNEKYIKLTNNKKPIRTASNIQARGKIVKNSVERWKNYESYFSSLYNNLNSYKYKN